MHGNGEEAIMPSYDDRAKAAKQSEDGSVEDDLNLLHSLDAGIRDMFANREALIDRISDKQQKNIAMFHASLDWFEGNVRGRPVPERDTVGEEPRERYR